jgi:hypothetical protein
MLKGCEEGERGEGKARGKRARRRQVRFISTAGPVRGVNRWEGSAGKGGKDVERYASRRRNTGRGRFKIKK